MKPIIQFVQIKQIKPNPHRMLNEYPWIANKLKVLQHSIKDVGFWEGVIVRPKGNKIFSDDEIKDYRGPFEMAFGHHRLEAAKNEGLAGVPVIVKQLDDLQMLKYMGRENDEDYKTDFLVMLNTWEGALRHLRHDRGAEINPLAIASILGWTRNTVSRGKSVTKCTPIAEACSSAHKLVEQELCNREEWEGLSVSTAKDIIQSASKKIKTIEVSGKKHNRPKKDIVAAKKHVAKGAKITAKEVKEGKIATKDVKTQVDVNAYEVAGKSKVKQSPLFAAFGKTLSNSIGKMLSTDATANKLKAIVGALDKITMPEDQHTISKILFEIQALKIRVDAWEKQLLPANEKVVKFKALERK